MRLAIYVPQYAATSWEPDAGGMSWESFLRRLSQRTGNISVTSAAGHWRGQRDGYGRAPVFIAETFIAEQAPYIGAWTLMREYAHQLVAQGEDSILIVQDNEPTIIK